MALAAFEHGAELSPTPMVWNNIAFNLAEHKIELDKAQQYAESAISTTEAKLRNIDLAHLDRRGNRRRNPAWLLIGTRSAGSTFRRAIFRRPCATSPPHGNWRRMASWPTIWGRSMKSRGRKISRFTPTRLRLPLPGRRRTHAPGLTLAAWRQRGNRSHGAAGSAGAGRAAIVPLAGLHLGDGAADFLIVLAPSGSNGASTKVEGVKFVSGSESLRALGEKPDGKLLALDYRTVFPDASPIKIVRRGTVSCSAKTGDCTLVLLRPEEMRGNN